jgi:hypothetical protein
MADSNITCSGLTARSGVGQLVLQWFTLQPSETALPYMALDTVEVWASTTNNRGAAINVGASGNGQFTHADVPAGATRFYWLRPRNASGSYGDWHPLAANAGVAGTAGTAQPGPGSITATELAPGAVTEPKLGNQSVSRAKLGFAAVGSAQIGYAEVTGANIGTAEIVNAHIVSVNANKIVAASLSAISANLGTVTAGTMNAVTINGGTLNSTTLNSVEIDGGRITAGVIRTRSSFPSISIQDDSGFGVVHLTVNSSSGQVARLSTVASGPVLRVDRNSASQFAASFQNNSASAVQGVSPTFAFYASAGAYGPFTGAHDALWPADEPLPEIGDIVADDCVVFRSGVSDTICRVGWPQAGRPAIGVFAAEMPLTQPTAAMPEDVDIKALAREFRLILVNAVGEGQINVCDASGPIEAGDLLIASPVRGKAMRQADDLLRAATVARAREAATFDASGRAQVACVYLSG